MQLNRRGRLLRALAILAVAGVVGGVAYAVTSGSSKPSPVGVAKTPLTPRADRSPSPRPRPTATRPADPFSEPALRRYLAGRRGDINAAVYNEKTGVTYCYRAGAKENTASIVKVDILATLLSQLQAAHATLSSSEVYLAETMIENSDNDSATALWNQVGAASGVAAFNTHLSMPHTVPNADGYWGLTQTTACDQVALLRVVAYPNALLSAASRAYEVGLMSDVEADQRWGIPGGIPAGVPVAVKNGWLPQSNGWQVNSDGYVHGRGADYVMSVMTSADATENYGIATIEGLSRYVWRDVR